MSHLSLCNCTNGRSAESSSADRYTRNKGIFFLNSFQYLHASNCILTDSELSDFPPCQNKALAKPRCYFQLQQAIWDTAQSSGICFILCCLVKLWTPHTPTQSLQWTEIDVMNLLVKDISLKGELLSNRLNAKLEIWKRTARSCHWFQEYCVTLMFKASVPEPTPRKRPFSSLCFSTNNWQTVLQLWAF